MSTVCIVGAGALGGAAAHALARHDRVHRIRLIDEAGAVAAGTALDIRQAGAVDRFHTELDGTDDPSAAAGASACVIADRAGASGREWEGPEGTTMLARVVPYLGDAPVLFAGASQSGLMLDAFRDLRLPRVRLIGSAPVALAGAARALTAIEAGCSPSEVRLAILGAPAAGFVIPWSEASIGGYSLERLLDQVQLRRLETRLDGLWPPGPFALGQAAAQLAGAVIGASRLTFSALTVLDGEFGVRGRVGIVPATVSPRGIAATRVPVLSTRERVRLETLLAG